jgi:hypothetical protein
LCIASLRRLGIRKVHRLDGRKRISGTGDWVTVWTLEMDSVDLGDEDVGLRKELNGFAVEGVTGQVLALLNELTMASMVRVRNPSRVKCLELEGSVLSDR